jgi:hypothetical protein
MISTVAKELALVLVLVDSMGCGVFQHKKAQATVRGSAQLVQFLLVRANFEFNEPSAQLLFASPSRGDMHLPGFLSSAERQRNRERERERKYKVETKK